MARDDRQTFERLKTILRPYEAHMSLIRDNEEEYYLDTGHVMKDGYAIFFGAVRLGKTYVSYHLMPLYTCTELQDRIPEILHARKQGKTCFNFRTLTDEQFAALTELTAACAEKSAQPGYLAQLEALRGKRA